MNDLLEAAKSGRSSCRACRKRIEQGEMRFGSDESGFYGDGDSYAWFHLRCAAQRMPDRALNALKGAGPEGIPDFDRLLAACERGVQRNASKYPYGERAPSSRSRCLKCQSAIEKGTLRVAIEREIDMGGFVQTAAGYLHPACAVAHLNEPELGEVLKRNSALLSAEDRDELARLCASAASPAEAPKRAARVAQETTRAEGAGDELVFADELLEKGDPRGELIAVASELADIGIDDARGPALAKRARELDRPARAAWAKELGTLDFELDRGLPSCVEVDLGEKELVLPEHRWIVGYRLEGATGAALDKLFAAREYERIRGLVLNEASFSWESYRAFCTSDAVKALRSLDIYVNVGARGVHMLLTATRFESLERLVLRSNWQATPDLRGFENVAGLRALRTLHLSEGMTAEMVTKLLASPLVQRQEELGVLGWAWPRQLPALPNLRRLYLLDGMLMPDSAKELVAAEAAGKLPSLRRLDLMDCKVDGASRKKLRAAFGDRLFVKEPKPKPAAAKKKTKKQTKKKAKRS